MPAILRQKILMAVVLSQDFTIFSKVFKNSILWVKSKEIQVRL